MVVLVECDCILYKGNIGNSGYGQDYDPETQKTISAHRLVFKQVNGFLPEVVMHICNNKQCVNPAHLKGGTQSENVLSAYKEGLQVNPHRKLSKEAVLDIRKCGDSQRSLAKKYGVTQRVIWGVRTRETYKDV